MAFADVAPLIVDLQLKDGLSGGLARAKGEVAGFGSTVGTAAVGGVGKLEAAMTGVGGAMSHAGSQLKGLVTGPAGILAMTGGMIGLAAGLRDTVTSATDFQSAMELIQTQAGGTQAEVEAMTQGILAMSTSVATAPDTLAAGLYHLESAGIRGQKALDALRIAAEGAKVGNADLESVTNALVGAINSGVKGSGDLAGTMGTLNAIVGAGNMRMQDLTDAFSTGILATAKTFGVSIQSVGAAIADMTNQGVPAIDAATRLRMSMSLLAAPTSAAAKEFKSIGLGQLDLANTMRGPGGIAAAITELATHMQKAGLIDNNGQPTSAGADLLSKAFGGGRSSSAIMTLIGSLGKLNDIQTQINTGAGNFDAAWAKTTQDAAFNFEKFQAAVGVIAIKLGNVLLPPLTAAAGAAADWLGSPDNQSSLVGGLNAVIGLAQQVGGAIKDYIIPAIKGIGDIWNAIPSQLRELLVGGFVANKAAGWLFGTSPLSAGRSLLSGLLGGVAGKVPVVGGVLGSVAGVPHVWVDNMPLGGIGGGGGIPGIGGAAGGALAPEAAGAAALGAGTLAAGVAAIVGAYYLPQYLAQYNPAAQPRTVTTGALAGMDITPTGTMSLDALSRGNPAIAALIAKNTRLNVPGETPGMPSFGALAQQAALAAVAATAKPTRDTYAKDAVLAQRTADGVAESNRRLALIAANTKDNAAGTDAQVHDSRAVRTASEKTASAAAAFRDRLVKLNADQNANSARERSLLATRQAIAVTVPITNNLSVSVSDIYGKQTTRVLNGNTVYYGNRPVGTGMGAT